tara:strand:- start:367 stop:915 length:549 start_codon:yes stop_codon:yes gene_type:complete
MDIPQHILSIVSRFPSGICGSDLRFALRLELGEFKHHIENLLVDQDLQVDLPNDYDRGRFRLNANLLLTNVQYNTVSKTIYDIHDTLQNYPQGLTVRELNNRTGYSEEIITKELIEETSLSFVQEVTDESFHTQYKTCLSEDISRLVETVEEVVPVQSPYQLIWWLSVTGGLLGLLFSQWFL